MRTLAIDTSSKSMSAAILDQHKILSEISVDAARNHGETALAAIEAVLSLSAVSLADIDIFACSVGPGSFTGLRVGIGTVKGLAYSLQKPVVGISSLDALAMNVSNEALTIWAMIDARRGEVYAARYMAMPGDIPQREGNELIITPGDLIEKVAGEAIFVGDGALVYEEYLKDKLQEQARFAAPADNRIKAGAVGVMGLKKYEVGASLTAFTLTPQYLRSSYASGVQFV